MKEAIRQNRASLTIFTAKKLNIVICSTTNSLKSKMALDWNRLCRLDLVSNQNLIYYIDHCENNPESNDPNGNGNLNPNPKPT